MLATQAGLGANAIDRALAGVGRENRARDRLARYSLRMKQRLGVAAALP